MNSMRHFFICVIGTVGILMVGTGGYVIIEGWPAMDALYMTMITISTVGYSEVNQVSAAGRVFTMFIVFIGVGFSLYVAGAVVQFMVEGRLRELLGRRRVKNRIKLLRNHQIVCGYGRTGKVVCEHLRAKAIATVAMDNDPDRIEEMEADRILYVAGDAAEEANLLQAGIKKACGLIAALASDADNVFLVLTARQLNPDLFIVARSSLNRSKPKLLAAGADYVESPYEMGAESMARRILRPTVTSFLDLALTSDSKVQMEEIPVNAASPLAGVMLKDSGIRQKFNLIIIAIHKADGSMVFNPSFEAVFKGGDTVIAVGEAENLRQLESILIPAKA